LGKSRSASDIRTVQDGCQGVQTTERRDRTAHRTYQRSFLDAQLVSDQIHLWLSEPRTIGRVVQGLCGGSGHTASGRHEPGGQGIRRLSDQDAGRVDPVAVRRSRRHHARGVTGQPVRARRNGARAVPSIENAIGRARTAHDPIASPGTVVGRELLDDVVLIINGCIEGRRGGPAEDNATATR